MRRRQPWPPPTDARPRSVADRPWLAVVTPPPPTTTTPPALPPPPPPPGPPPPPHVRVSLRGRVRLRVVVECVVVDLEVDQRLIDVTRENLRVMTATVGCVVPDLWGGWGGGGGGGGAGGGVGLWGEVWGSGVAWSAWWPRLASDGAHRISPPTHPPTAAPQAASPSSSSPPAHLSLPRPAPLPHLLLRDPSPFGQGDALHGPAAAVAPRVAPLVAGGEGGG